MRSWAKQVVVATIKATNGIKFAVFMLCPRNKVQGWLASMR
jgi:hypothetical protein